MSFIKELKRRNVFRVAVAYAVISWLLIQVADTLTPALRLPDWIVSAISLVLLLGFIPSMLFSWAYEITPEGIKKESEVDRNNSVTAHTAKKLDIITLISVLGLAGLIVWQQLRPTTPIAQPVPAVIEQSPTVIKAAPQKIIDKPQEESIAVLPFADMSQDGNQEYFADGISEEILNALVKATGLRVAGRTSSFSFKGKDATIKDIGEALNVAHVLEGSVRKHNNTVRITAQLIRVDNGFHLWSETYNGSLDNIFDLQDSISKQVTEELKIILELNDDERLASKMTNNIDAYDFYLRGREQVAKRVDGGLSRGMELLKQAVELDPNFAEAWAVLAEAEAVSPGYMRQTVEESALANQRALSYATTSIALNEGLALPHAVRGLISSDEAKYLKSISELEQALKLEPNNTLAIRWLGNLYSMIDQNQKAILIYERAFANDPLSSINSYNLAASNFKLGNADEAIRYFKMTGDLRNSIMPQISHILNYQGHAEAAKDWTRSFINKQKEFGRRESYISEEDLEIYIKGMFGGNEQDKEAARKLGTILIKGDDDSGAWQLEGHLAIGNIDRVYEILKNKPNLFTSFSGDYMWLPTDGIKAFRTDPRFIPLLLKHKIPDTWLALGWSEHCTPNDGTDGSNGQFTCE